MRLNFQPHHSRPAFCAACIIISLLSQPCFAQAAPPQSTAGAQTSAPLVITLDEAIHRAQANEPNFATARAEAKATALDRSIARAALLPNAIYHNQFLYTQGTGGSADCSNGVQTPVIFIANNSVHEYISQAAVTETIGLKRVADVRLADATAARAAAEYEDRAARVGSRRSWDSTTTYPRGA